MMMSDVEAIQIYDVAGMRSDHDFSKAVYWMSFPRAERRKQTTAFPFAVSLQFQLTYINVEFLSRRSCQMLEMDIAESF
jgi:hypothetical protein